MVDALARLDSSTWVLIAIAAVGIIPLLCGVVQGLRGKEPKRTSVGKAIAGVFEPGGFLHERNEAVRPAMERRGLTFKYWVYRPPDGASITLPWQQLKSVGGSFQMIVTPLQEVYQGTVDGTAVTIGHVYTGAVGDREERMATIFTAPGRTFPTFVAAPRRFARGAKGETLHVLAVDEITAFVEEAFHLAALFPGVVIAAAAAPRSRR